jgi:hypothetical protein
MPNPTPAPFPPPAAGPVNPNDFAVVVGIGRYPDLGDLGGPRTDATEFAKWLCDPAGGGLDPRQVCLILSPDPALPPPSPPPPAHPIRDEILAAFDWLDTVAVANNTAQRGLQVGRRLYLFFAGHGFAPDGNQTALLMANATPQWVGYHVLGPAYADWFYRAGYFNEILLFMDCCREAYPLAPMNPPHFMNRTDPTAPNRVKRFYGYGTRWSKKSREREIPPGGPVRGVFTTALLAGLRGAAADRAGWVTSASLNDYLFQNMRTFLSEDDRQAPTIPKEPDISVYPTVDPTWVIATVAAPPTGEVQISPQQPGALAQLVDGKFQLVNPKTAGPPTWTFQVSPGLYLARSVAAAGMPILAEQSVTLSAGGSHHVQL